MSAPAADRVQPHHPANEWAVETHVYEPHTVGLPPVREYLKEVWRRREFAHEMARTNIRAQNLDTVFGQIWLVLNPVLQAAVYFVLIDIIRQGDRPESVIAHLTAAIFAFHFVSQGIRGGATSLTRGGRLILNSAFPKMLLPLSAVVEAFRRFLPCIPLYIIFHVVFDRPVDAHTLWVFPLFAMFSMLALGLGLFAGTLQVYFRDLKSFLPYAIRLMLFSAPILYFASEVPDKYEIMFDLNPVGALMAAWEQVLYYGDTPSLRNLVVGLIWSVGSLLIGSVFFMSREREIAVRL
jgi:ABC-type polysaccharide/polyol phosphate export permease